MTHQVDEAKSRQLRSLGESLDRLITIDLTGRSVIHALHRAARERQGDEPLSSRAARSLVERVGPRDVVLISTGMPVGTLPSAEQDGPVGAATLARSLVIGLSATPVVVTEERNVPLMTDSLRSAGLYVLPVEIARSQPTGSSVISFPLDSAAAPQASKTILDGLRPKALVAIERAGANERGEHHAALGRNLTAHNSKQDVMFEMARESGVLTICIGDGGNELGCGMIRDAVIAAVPVAARCRCPCGGTVVPAFVPDVLIMASVSNWGAYAIEAGIAAAVKRPEALHDRDVDLRVHTVAALAGANNDGPRLLDPGTDAVPARYHGHLLELMAELVKSSADLGGLYRSDKWPWVHDR